MADELLKGKINLHNKLRSNGFEDVFTSLEQAESNFELEIKEEGYRKSCNRDFRDAVECFISIIRMKKLNDKPKKTNMRSFSEDNKKLIEKGFL